MLSILKYMKKRDWQLFIIATIFVVLQVYFDLKVPDYMSQITTLVKTEGSEMSEIYHAGIMMFICAFFSLVTAFAAKYSTSKLGTQYAFGLREDIFNRIESFSNTEIDRFSTASLITRSTNDVTQLQNFVAGGMSSLITTPITLIVAIVKISHSQWQWSALTAVCCLIIINLLIVVVTYAQPKIRKLQSYTDELNKVMRETLTGVRVIRAYNAEEYQNEKFADANEILTSNSYSARKIMTLMQPTMKFLNSFLNVGIYCIGAYLIYYTGSDNQLELFSEMVVFSTYAAKIIRSFMALERIFMMLPRAAVSSERITEVLNTEPSIKDGTFTEGLPEEKGKVEFRNVSFKYNGDEGNAIEDITFTANPGETVAFIGATGSGKTTLVNLVARFYDATEGEVLIDGRNVKDYKLNSLYDIVGYTPQAAVLFTGTVESNINYGESNTDNETDIQKVLEVAQASDFVNNMKEGINSTISRGGTNVSGGQKQRLSVARTIRRKPEIYIFDDTFSALDYQTDRNLRDALKKYTNHATTLIVAQRIGTIREADKIIVLDDGKIVGMGTHQQLMQNCTVYQEIASTQLSKEELM